jgi:DNA-binding transcriptional LysR family regulator
MQSPIAPAVPFDFVDLRLFINVAEVSSLTGAASASALSLPAASARIKNLEAALGVQLLYRTKRGVSLTPAGDSFLHHARLMLAQVQHLGTDLRQFAQGLRGHVRLYANTTAVAEFLPQALGRFLADHPPVSIDLRELPSQEVVRAVHEGKTDIGIVAGYVSTSGLQTRPYFSDRLMLAVPSRHPLAGRRNLPFADAVGFDFVGLGLDSAMHGFITRIARDEGWELRMRIHVGSYDAMCRMIEAGVGIGLLAESAARRHARSAAVRVLGLEDSWALQPLQVCARDFDALPGLARELVLRLIDSPREESRPPGLPND